MVLLSSDAGPSGTFTGKKPIPATIWDRRSDDFREPGPQRLPRPLVPFTSRLRAEADPCPGFLLCLADDRDGHKEVRVVADPASQVSVQEPEIGVKSVLQTR